MSCLNPIRVPNPRYKSLSFSERVSLADSVIDVPCGLCPNCLARKQREWKARITLESHYHKFNYFVTFTLAPENVDKFCKSSNPTLPDIDKCKREFRKYFDRIRKTYGYMPFKHLIVSEKGSKKERLHFHGILFSDIPLFGEEYPLTFSWMLRHVQQWFAMNDQLSKPWKHGFATIGFCEPRTISYVTKYITKDVTNSYRPLLLVSPGIGKSYLLTDNKQIDQSKIDELRLKYSLDNLPKVELGFMKIALPQYLRNKIWTEDERHFNFINYCSLKNKNPHIFTEFLPQTNKTYHIDDPELHEDKTFWYHKSIELDLIRKRKKSPLHDFELDSYWTDLLNTSDTSDSK